MYKEADVHAIVVTVKIEPGHDVEAAEQLQTTVLPRVKETPGVVSGYWLAPVEGRGFSLLLLENEEAARSAAAMISNAPRPDFVSFDSIEVREVIAQI
jgi:hypothetical protein